MLKKAAPHFSIFGFASAQIHIKKKLKITLLLSALNIGSMYDLLPLI